MVDPNDRQDTYPNAEFGSGTGNDGTYKFYDQQAPYKPLSLYENKIRNMISESVKRVLNEGQYEKGYDSGQFLIKTRIDRYGDAEGKQKIRELYYKMLNNLENSKEYGFKIDQFTKGQFDSIEKYIDSIGI